MSHCYRFDRFELRPAERLLYVDGQPANLGARAIDLLLMLVERHGRMVSKAELLDLVWPGLVVEENNLQVQISTLRKLLGPRAIATIPGRGYRFTVPVMAEESGLRAGAFLTGPPQSSSGAGGLDPVASPSRGLPSVLSVLPVLPVRLLGRDADLAAMEPLREHGLITLVGPGGIGKTSFALATAHRWRRDFRDGVAWVELAGIQDPALVTTVVAQALGLPSGGQDALGALVTALEDLQVLVVVDNAEHLQRAVAEMAQAVTARAPDVRMLVTSQVALQVNGERVFRLHPLSVPDTGVSCEEAMEHGAVALFVGQAQAADRRFELGPDNLGSVIALCQRLDGLALAIKLAAARIPLLGLQGILDRLDQRFRLLASPPGTTTPSRQQTLLGALDWSHELLDESEKAVFRRLSVFAGGFTLHLASVVARDAELDDWAVIDLLGQLVDRSLVAVDNNDMPRYRLLESTLAYARLKLAQAGESDEFERRHAGAVAALMEEAYELYWSTPDVPWLEAYGHEIDNIRAALDWATDHQPELAVELVGASSVLFLLLGLAPECRQRFLALEPVLAGRSADRMAARYWLERSRLHWGISSTLMDDFALRAADLFRGVPDDRGLFLALRCRAGSAALLAHEGVALIDDMARLEHPRWPPRLRLQRLLAQIGVLRSTGQVVAARDVAETLLMRAEAAGLEAVVSAALSDLAGLCLSMADHDQALHYCRQLLSRARHRRDNFILHALAITAAVSLHQGDASQARGALADFAVASRSRDWEWFGLYSGLFAWMSALEGRHEAAALALGYAKAVHQHLVPGDHETATAWARTQVLIERVMEASAVVRLAAQGTELSPEAVCSLALGHARPA